MLVVLFRLPDGTIQSVGPGALIGRMGRADIQLDDGRVSEAHALVSLRGRSARLLSLRGRFAVDGKPSTNVELERGLRIEIAPGLVLEVEDVILPARVLALCGPGGVHVPVGVTSLLPGLPVRIVHGWRPDAEVVLWPVDTAWHTATGPLESGTVFEVSDQQLVVQWIDSTGADHTHRTGSWADPLVLVTRFDSVHLLRERAPTLVLVGIQARFLTELALAKAPLDWHDLAQSIWPDEDRVRLRRRWDLHQYRLRRRLRDAGVREDLVRADGSGLVELVLGPHDEWRDES